MQSLVQRLRKSLQEAHGELPPIFYELSREVERDGGRYGVRYGESSASQGELKVDGEGCAC